MVAALFLLAGVDPSIQLSDLDRFPAGAAWQQVGRCQDHLERLRCLSSVRGYEGGRWDRAVAETEGRLGYWQLLDQAQSAWLLEQPARQRLLFQFKSRIGPARYLQGWSPPLLPEWPAAGKAGEP